MKIHSNLRSDIKNKFKWAKFWFIIFSRAFSYNEVYRKMYESINKLNMNKLGIFESFLFVLFVLLIVPLQLPSFAAPCVSWI